MGFAMRVLRDTDTRYIDELLFDEKGRLRLVPASELRKIPHEHLMVWANKNARYGIPCVELIELLTEMIKGRDAIEIGAGFGDFGRHLGIRMTDSAAQTRPDARDWYRLIGQPIIDPPEDVERIDANSAVVKHKPRVVFASWVTQLWMPGDDGPPQIGSSVHGVDEGDIIDRTDMYILLGNESVHYDKRILRRPHRQIQTDFLFSRGFDRDGNFLYVWGE